MRRMTSMAAVALALGLGGTAALAEEHELFMQVDADSDGQITKEEFVGYSEQTYRDALENPDDKLFTRDYAEQRVHRDDEPVDTINLDPDEDEYTSLDEAMADWDTSFSSLDEDGDGVIDEDEWAAVGK